MATLFETHAGCRCCSPTAKPTHAKCNCRYPRIEAEGPPSARVDAFERETLLGELKRNQFRMADTARALGLERSHLYKKCQQHGIDLRALRGR